MSPPMKASPLYQPLLAMAMRLALGGLFVVAGLLKLRDPAGFAQEIVNYDLAPVLAPYLAIALPAVEVVAGLALIAFPPAWRRAGAVTVAGLMLMFLVATLVVIARGVNIECGCFGTGSGPVGWSTVLRDLALLGLAVLLAAPAPSPAHRVA
jgi:putative oxidoreductase